MKQFVPHYYDKFTCIADKCRDNCCIGWEIDIDPDTLEMYRSMDGNIGRKLSENITVSDDGSDCFRLTSDGRCPFLNESNLCELILAGGEDMLCGICHMHPRFVNYLPDRCETGLGLCCEEAARIILTDREPFRLVETQCSDEEELPSDIETDFLMYARDYIIGELEKSGSIPYKTGLLLGIGEILDGRLARGNYSPLPDFTDTELHYPDRHFHENAGFILSLEPLNDEWNKVCGMLRSAADSRMTFEYDISSEREYTNLLKYYIYRYFMDSADDFEPYLKLALAVFSADAVTYIKKATGMSFIDSACLWSKEIEYSAENMEMIYDYLYPDDDLAILNEQWDWAILLRRGNREDYIS